LKSQGICSLAELQSSSLSLLTGIFGSREKANTIWGLSFGIDDSPVKSSGKQKSIGIEDAFKEIRSVPEAKEKIKVLLGRLLDLLLVQEEKRQPGTVKLTIRKVLKSGEWKRESRQMPLQGLAPFNSSDFVPSSLNRVMPLLLELFGKMVASGEVFHLTLVGVAFANFSERRTGPSSIDAFLQPVAKKCKLETQSCEKSSVAEATTSKPLELPPYVDPQVFNTLPQAIKDEIIRDWKESSSHTEEPIVKKKQSIKDYFGGK
jgi:DNA polymerase iota